MRYRDIPSDIKSLREKWRSLRSERLKIKTELLSLGLSKRDIRHDRNYRRLKKDQMHLSKIIKHIEKKGARSG